MTRLFAVFSFLVFWFSTAGNAQEAVEIGKAVEIVNTVRLLQETGLVPAAVGSKIRSYETVITGGESTGQFELLDKTMLAVGPDSELLLDRFVFNPDPNLREVVVTHFKGAIRFVTGDNPSETYTIKTPTATIGVRGTKFDVYINDDGETLVGLLDGRVNVCNRAQQAQAGQQTNECRSLQQAGRFLHVPLRGKLKLYHRLPNRLLGAGGFAAAFPFLGGRFRLRGKLAARFNIRAQIRKRAGLAPERRPANRRAQRPNRNIRKTRPQKRNIRRVTPPQRRPNNRLRPNQRRPGGNFRPGGRIRPGGHIRPGGRIRPGGAGPRRPGGRGPRRPGGNGGIFLPPYLPGGIDITIPGGRIPGFKRPGRPGSKNPNGNTGTHYPRYPNTGPKLRNPKYSNPGLFHNKKKQKKRRKKKRRKSWGNDNGNDIVR